MTDNSTITLHKYVFNTRNGNISHLIYDAWETKSTYRYYANKDSDSVKCVKKISIGTLGVLGESIIWLTDRDDELAKEMFIDMQTKIINREIKKLENLKLVLEEAKTAKIIEVDTNDLW